MPEQHEVTITSDMSCQLDPQECAKGDTVNWTASPPVKDWIVIFGPGAPVEPKMASSLGKNSGVEIIDKGHRGANDLRHVKYYVVGLVKGELQYKDPKLIVRP